MLPYSFTAEWVNGKDHLAADALSHFSVYQLSLDDELCDTHTEAAVHIQFYDKFINYEVFMKFYKLSSQTLVSLKLWSTSSVDGLTPYKK